jgi:hypothetical protein
MLHIAPDTPQRARRRARVAPAEPGDGWVKPKHGKGMLRPFQPGNHFAHNSRPSRYHETVALAREAAPEAVQVLIHRMHDSDGRVAIVAATAVLERAYGKVKEMQLEQQAPAHIDLSQLSNAELTILVQLAASGRLRAASDAQPAAEIEGEVDPVGGAPHAQ